MSHDGRGHAMEARVGLETLTMHDFMRAGPLGLNKMVTVVILDLFLIVEKNHLAFH